jgi:peroxiredoxin
MFRTLIVTLCVFAAACGSKEKKPEPTPAENPTPSVATVKNERPVMTLTLTDGSQIDAQALNEQMVLVLFQPDCDHCQNEATQIRKRLNAFKDYQLYFISSQPMEAIQKFAKDYKLYDLPNVHFGFTTVENVLNNYGAISAPSIYIYTKEGRLVESFDGLVDVEVVIKYL